jgi:GNAT superfamily N-acetyltransferase
MRFMDLQLARRVEHAEGNACRECAEAFHLAHPEFPVAVEEIGGGVAVFAGVDSPVTQAVGVGLGKAVTDEDLDRLGDFFLIRNAPAAIELCPLVEMSLYEKFAARGYRLLEVSNVLIREIASAGEMAPASPPDVTARRALREEAKLWTSTVAQGFVEQFPVTPEMLDVMEGFFQAASGTAFLAYLRGEVAGGAALAMHRGVCGLFGASTLPDCRRRGVQTALLGARIAWAANHGCDLAVSIAAPASISQRNIERAGFRVAYTRTKLIRPLAANL